MYPSMNRSSSTWWPWMFLHSLYIPAFRVKEDMVPGQEKVMWFIPGTDGEFDLFCTEYCGLEHSYMFTGCKGNAQGGV